MIISDVIQGSDEWFNEKLGKPSASNCSKIIKMDGKPSTQRAKYMYLLASEIVTGQRHESYKNENMEIGNEREQEARDLYCMLNDVSIDTVGVCYKDNLKRYLCSPDGIINNSEGIEIKNVLPSTQAERLHKNRLPSEYFGQTQFSLFVTGFDKWNFFSYCPRMRPLHIIVNRDEKFIKSLEIELNLFCDELDELVKRIK